VFQSVFVPILTYGHNLVLTERILSQVQALEVGFLQGVYCVTLRGKVRSCENREVLNVARRLLRIERSQPRLFGHVTRGSHEKLPR